MILDIRDESTDNKLRCSRAAVFINGVKETNCVRCDDQKGIATFYYKDVLGNYARDRRGRALTKTIKCAIKIVLPAGVPGGPYETTSI